MMSCNWFALNQFVFRDKLCTCAKLTYSDTHSFLAISWQNAVGRRKRDLLGVSIVGFGGTVAVWRVPEIGVGGAGTLAE